MKNKTKQRFFYLSLLAIILSVFSCEKDDNDLNESSPLDEESRTSMIERMNNDIKSLKNIVLALQEDDSVTTIKKEENGFVIDFVNHSSSNIILDNADYVAPMVGIHKIDKDYYWTQITGSGTSATTLLKSADRKNYQVKENGITPQFNITDKGTWEIQIEKGDTRDVFDSEGKPFRAIGAKSLFKSIEFDVDSNAIITTNEIPSRIYTVPKHRPFTFLLGSSIEDTITIASGFSIPLDFISSGVTSIEFNAPTGWDAKSVFEDDNKSGVLTITAPTGMEGDFVDKGSIEIIANNEYGGKRVVKIDVKSEVGLINFATVLLKDQPNDIDIKSATFTFIDNTDDLNQKTVSSIKFENEFRLMLPDGYSVLRHITFTTNDQPGNNTFVYYLPPEQSLTIGSQEISIAPPELRTYWKGGIIVHINEPEPRAGIAAYNITGKVSLVLQESLNMFVNGNFLPGATSDTDGTANTAAWMQAMGSPWNGSNAKTGPRWADWVSFDGYNDWFVPAIKELEMLYLAYKENPEEMNNAMIKYGGIALEENMYWSSTDVNNPNTKALNFLYNTDYFATANKTYRARVKPFRNF